MSDNTFKKSPTAFLQNRLSMNRLIQNGSKKRIEKEIEYLNANDETATEKSAFIEINRNLNQQVDGNKAVIDGTCPVWNPKMFKSAASLRIKTPGFRENSAKYEDAFYTSKARQQGDIASTLGLNTAFVRTLKGETRQLDSATFLKVACGTVPLIRVTITSGNVSKFLACTDMYGGHEYLTWTDGTSTYYTDFKRFNKDGILYSDTALTTAVGLVNACYVDDVYSKPLLAGMFRSVELDETVGQTNYCGWFYFANYSGIEFTQIYTTKEKPSANDPIYLRDIATGTYVQFPTSISGVTGAGIKVSNWSAPATMFDVDYEYDYVDTGKLIPEKVKDESNDIKVIDVDPGIITTHYHYNLRALISGYEYWYPIVQIKVVNRDGEETITIGTFNFDTYYDGSHVRWKNVDTSAALEYVYSYYVDDWWYYSDEELTTAIGNRDDESTVLSDTPEEFIYYMAYAAPTGNYAEPQQIYVPVTPDYSSTDRRDMIAESYYGVDFTSYITEKWWNTANIGYGEVSSQTTLYTETVFRYKDLDAHLSQYLPANWEGNAYGCIIVADSSATGPLEGETFLGVSHSDFFIDGSDVYYIIPTNAYAGGTGENGPYELIHAYVYDAALNSIYSTNFGIDTTVGSVTTTHHYISDATHNYKVDGKWRYHYACVEDKTKDIYARRLAYDRSDLYYLVNGVETPLAANQTLVTPQLFPYSTLYYDNSSSTYGNCAWYDFYHTDLAYISGFTFTSTFITNKITATPTGGSTAITLFRSQPNDGWRGSNYCYCWKNTDDSIYVYSYTEKVSVGDRLDGNVEVQWGTVTTLENVSRQALRTTGRDSSREVEGLNVPMYCWEFPTDPSYEESNYWTIFTDTLVPTTSTHLWTDYGDTWSDIGVTPSMITSSLQTWYRYHTSNKEIYFVGDEAHERFQTVWATSRNPYEEVTLCHSNYDAHNPAVPTTPNLSNTISFWVNYQCYIAPAYQLVVTYDGIDYTFTAAYNLHNPEFRGILASGWVCDDFKEPLFASRITPHIGDILYTVDGNNAAIVAEGFTIKEVKSVVDFIYPGRA